MDKIFFSRLFYERDRLCDATYGRESRVSGRIDRIAHPIAAFSALHVYIGTRIYMTDAEVDANAKTVGEKGDQP